VLIIREKGAKMPADLGGNIFATLDDYSNIEPIKGVIRSFLEKSNLFESCPSPLLEID
jgi:hypothetical protein